MKHEELIKMSAQELRERLQTINTQAKTAEGQALKDLLEEAKDIQGILADAQNRAALAGIAADNAGAAAEEEHAGEAGSNASAQIRAAEARGAALKNGGTVRYKAENTFRRIKNTLSSSQTVMPHHTAPDVRETFNNVSSLVDRVRVINLEGGETYQRGFVKSYGDGAGPTAEGADYNASEPTFGYVDIEKEKITAYTEEPEEMIKLPNADYDGVVEGSVTRAVRRYMSRQILIGNGTTGKFKGIFYNPVDTTKQVIDPDTDIEVSAIDDATLDEIVYSYGGDEEVEDIAVLILNKKDLKAFAKLRDKQGRKVYTIVNHGNTGTIDSVPYVINSACYAVTDASTAADSYCMAYGPLENYEMAVFSPIDARKSTEYKFKQGQVAYRADVFAGGAVAAWNGFIRVKKATE